jgi:glycosyltransferase involved in cell wall biosynthesis
MSRPVAAQPAVGIGVPVYNGARVLRATLDSLLAQTFADFEILVSDNASTDETPAICEEYVARDPRVRYVRQAENVGAPHNWNFVAQHARGRYFKWASSNDLLEPDMVQACVDALESDRTAVLAFGRTALIDAEGDIVKHYAEDFAVLEATPSARFRSVYSIALNNAINGVIRMDVLRRTGLIRAYPASDYVLMGELALQGRFLLVPNTLLYRRTDPASITTGLKRMDRLRLHNPATTGVESIDLRRHRDSMWICLRAPGLSARERFKSFAIALRSAFWARRQIVEDLGQSLRALLTLARIGRSR